MISFKSGDLTNLSIENLKWRPFVNPLHFCTLFRFFFFFFNSRLKCDGFIFNSKCEI